MTPRASICTRKFAGAVFLPGVATGDGEGVGSGAGAGDGVGVGEGLTVGVMVAGFIGCVVVASARTTTVAEPCTSLEEVAFGRNATDIGTEVEATLLLKLGVSVSEV